MSDPQEQPFVRRNVVTYDPWTDAAEGLAEAIEDTLRADTFLTRETDDRLRAALEHYHRTVEEYDKGPSLDALSRGDSSG